MVVDKSKKVVSKAWVEKYRSLKVEAMILPPPIRKMFKAMIEKGEIDNNLLLYSTSPGTGKTTVARALLKDCGYDYKEINASVDTGVDTLRTTIERYASSQSFSGKKKAIILDEFDRASPAFQDGLKSAMERFLSTGSCVFICICNRKTRLIGPLLSRLEKIDFSFSNEKYKNYMVPQFARRMEIILDREGIAYDKEVLANFVGSHYPDFREVINTCQQYVRVNSSIDTGIFSYQSIDSELYTLILSKKITKAREFIAANNYDYEELFDTVMNELIPMLPANCRPQAWIELSVYADRATRTANKELHFVAFLTSLSMILNEHDA